MDFEPFPKLMRLSKDWVVTEKLDGTNAQIVVTEDGQLIAGSRNRYLTADSDNYGFAKWVERNAEELLKLGVGRHFGEWYGNGIQRRYGLAEKRFALFNTHRWGSNPTRPACCDVVPVLFEGYGGDLQFLADCMEDLRDNGSKAVPGFMNPEGLVAFHKASGLMFKKTFEYDEAGKWAEAA